jgi:hypothetical protein
MGQKRYEQILLGDVGATSDLSNGFFEELRGAILHKTGPERCVICHCNELCYKYVEMTRSRPCCDTSWCIPAPLYIRSIYMITRYLASFITRDNKSLLMRLTFSRMGIRRCRSVQELKRLSSAILSLPKLPAQAFQQQAFCLALLSTCRQR